MFAFSPRKELELSSPLSPEAATERLSEVTEPSEKFPLRSKLSGAGIVVRVLHPPDTDKALFGRVAAEGFKVARVPDPQNQGPFQPIAEGSVSDSGQGSTIQLVLRPHKQVRTYSPIFAGAALVLLAAAGVMFGDKPAIAVIALVFGGLLLVFPRFRAAHGFERGCQELEASLRRVFESE